MSGALVPYRPSQHQQQAQYHHHQHPQHHQNGPQNCQLICESCRTLLVYPEGSSRVRCALCSFVTNVPPQGTEVAHVQCDGCRVTLMYPGGAHAVKCAFCQYITCLTPPTTEEGTKIQTVIVENPLTLDDTGRLVGCVSVGISKRRF